MGVGVASVSDRGAGNGGQGGVREGGGAQAGKGGGRSEEGCGTETCVANAGEEGGGGGGGSGFDAATDAKEYGDAGEYGVDLKFLCRKHAGESIDCCCQVHFTVLLVLKFLCRKHAGESIVVVVDTYCTYHYYCPLAVVVQIH